MILKSGIVIRKERFGPDSLITWKRMGKFTDFLICLTIGRPESEANGRTF